MLWWSCWLDSVFFAFHESLSQSCQNCMLLCIVLWSIIMNIEHYISRTIRNTSSTKLLMNILTSSLTSSLINRHSQIDTEEASLSTTSMQSIFQILKTRSLSWNLTISFFIETVKTTWSRVLISLRRSVLLMKMRKHTSALRSKSRHILNLFEWSALRQSMFADMTTDKTVFNLSWMNQSLFSFLTNSYHHFCRLFRRKLKVEFNSTKRASLKAQAVDCWSL